MHPKLYARVKIKTPKRCSLICKNVRSRFFCESTTSAILYPLKDHDLFTYRFSLPRGRERCFIGYPLATVFFSVLFFSEKKNRDHLYWIRHVEKPPMERRSIGALIFRPQSFSRYARRISSHQFLTYVISNCQSFRNFALLLKLQISLRRSHF